MKHKPSFTNRPKHILQDNCFYFITVRTIEGQWFLQAPKYKQILFKVIKTKTSKFGCKLVAYTILNNHYHLLLEVSDAKILPKFIKELNGTSSHDINTADNAIGRKIWWNYYSHIISDESDFFKHLNYIHQNPIKHQVSKSLVYEFSSYSAWLKKKGKEYLDDVFVKYPIVDFKSFEEL